MTSEFRLERFHNGTEYRAYEFFGCHRLGCGKYVFRVWAPRAVKVQLKGTFSDDPIDMERLPDGESFQAETEAKAGDLYVYLISTADGRVIEKADPYAYSSDLPKTYRSKICDIDFSAENSQVEIADYYSSPVNIYEVSLLSWKRHKNGGYYSYRELIKTLVPYVKKMNYTHVEFMPITEFPYDGSWGYQVTGYFAVTARLGAPQDFKALVDAFHENGIKVILDWVPAHFPKDDWGLYEFDGQPLYECPLWDRMEHSGWGTRKFDYGRGEVDSFLLSSAEFFLSVYGVDGLRVDAVASMLYLDYDRAFHDCTLNVYGDNRNLEAIEFIKKFNSTIKTLHPGAITIAEESTAFPQVTSPVNDGGLGFDFKWNLGWMNDTLFYCRQDPYFRNHHHNKITFSMMYAFNEKYLLPLSHDEVVHVKGSIVNKMPGEYADKFAGERALLGYMYAHPGKKLNFMGYEVAQFSEWNYKAAIEFELKKFEKHAKMTDFVKALNSLYLNCPALYEIENDWKGFEWLVVDDKFNNLLAFSRYSNDGRSLTAIINFSGVDLKNYRLGIAKGSYKIILSTDEKRFGGDGKFTRRTYNTRRQSSHGKEYSISVDVPKLACLYLIKQK